MTRWSVLGLAMSGAFGLAMLASACGSHKGSSAAAPQDFPDGSGGPDDSGTVGQIDGGLSNTGLPTLPELVNVVATEREDSVGIDFDPIDDAVDYRVYPLPSPGDITVNGDGSLTIKNAIYRCAGLRQTYDLPNNVGNDLDAPDAGQVYENFNPQFSWTVQVAATPTLGYVYVTPGAGLVPVYAIGEHPTAPEVGWRETRPKIYTTDATVRASLLGSGGRDDGIVFYVPSAAGPTTTTIYHSENVVQAGENFTAYSEYYFTSADMASHASDTTPPAPAFQVLTATAAGAQPLMAVFYQPGENHTELAVGKERFKRAAYQGPGPLWHLEWAGITQPTTLVVEALSSGCPFQGFLSPQSLDAPPHQSLFTLAEIQSASPTGEVYVNGQYDLPGTSFTILTGNGAMGGMWAMSDAGLPMLQTPNASPIPVARSFVQVVPKPHDPTAWDWYEGFNVGSDFGTVVTGQDPTLCMCQMPGATVACQNGDGACGYWTSPTLDVGAYEIDDTNKALFTYGQFLGQFWDALDDVAQDVTGSARFTVPTQATMSTDTNQFLHVTWTTNTVSTDRRYPQLIVSDQPSPIQDGFANPNSNTLLIQTRIGPSMLLEVEAFHGLVNGKPWQVNNQSPIHALIDYDTWNSAGGNPSAPTGMPQPITPADPPFEHSGVDRMTRYDAYISGNRVYVFMDGAPAGCTQYASNGFALSGPVSVTFGDVLYHEAAPDELICAQARPYPFMHEHQCSETKRQWDDLGFKSSVGPPAWDSVNYPCAAF
jgi:hypothetical protein